MRLLEVVIFYINKEINVWKYFFDMKWDMNFYNNCSILNYLYVYFLWYDCYVYLVLKYLLSLISYNDKIWFFCIFSLGVFVKWNDNCKSKFVCICWIIEVVYWVNKWFRFGVDRNCIGFWKYLLLISVRLFGSVMIGWYFILCWEIFSVLRKFRINNILKKFFSELFCKWICILDSLFNIW